MESPLTSMLQVLDSERVVHFLRDTLGLFLDPQQLGRVREIYKRSYESRLYDRPLHHPGPVEVYVDPATVCQLRCPLCPTGNGTSRLAKRLMPLSDFIRIIEGLPDAIKNLNLYNWGESLLNRDIVAMIRHAKARGWSVHIHTNLSLQKPVAFFEELISSGLDDLIISADGVTQETYQRYRVRGRLSLVLENMRKLVTIKRALGGGPRLTWKMIVNRYSEHEVERGRQLAQEIGVEFMTSPFGVGEYLPDPDIDRNEQKRRLKVWLPEDREHWREHYQKGAQMLPIHPAPCVWPFERSVVTTSGKVLPCCYVSDEKWAFGDLNLQSFEEIWNGSHYKSARAHFSNERLGAEEVVETICDHCQAFRKVRRGRR